MKSFMGFGFLLAGLGVGVMMYLQPEGLNPAWPLWAAELVPVMFAIGGVYMICDALGYLGVAARLLQALLVCMLVVLHWIAFFVSDGQCSASLGFLGISLTGWQLDAQVCRFVLLLFVGTIDAAIIIPAGIQAWRRRRESDDASLKR